MPGVALSAGTGNCPCAWDCYGESRAARLLRFLYQPSCPYRKRARSKAAHLGTACGWIAVAAGTLIGRTAASHWLLVPVPCLVGLWAGFLAKSGILPRISAAILLSIQGVTLAALIAPGTTAIWGGASANLLLWTVAGFRQAPKESVFLTSTTCLLGGIIAAGVLPFRLMELPAAAVILGLTFLVSRPGPSMPRGLFYPGYITTI